MTRPIDRPSPKPKKNGGNNGGGTTTYGDHASQPPPFSYDPALEAQRRAAQRGLKDVKFDTRRDLQRNRQDWRTQRRDIMVNKRRGMKDIGQAFSRGKQDIGFQVSDVRLRGKRGQQDFGIRLNNLVQDFAARRGVDRQQINVGGLAESGALAASDRIRGAEFARQKQVIDLGSQRLAQDTHSDLSRLKTSLQRLRQDTRTDRTRLKQDTRHDIRLGGRDYLRGKRDLKTSLQRAIREAMFADSDLLAQEIFDARQRNPGAFTKYGTKKG